tara:strand:+ start:463 stop:660 length:198 start_codon:yes stop_codon:yes gene_type:complete
MITSDKKVIRQNTYHISFKSNNEERNMYHQVLRRATLTSTPVSTVIKQYINEGVKNDRFLQMFDR